MTRSAKLPDHPGAGDFGTTDTETIFDLARRLTGTAARRSAKHDVIVSAVRRRMTACCLSTLEAYLDFTGRDDPEFARLISALTIHTTSWFREAPHFEALDVEQNLAALAESVKLEPSPARPGAADPAPDNVPRGDFLESHRPAAQPLELVGGRLGPLH